MCLYRKKTSLPRIAIWPKTVYKVLLIIDDEFVTPYMRTTPENGVIIKSRKNPLSGLGCRIIDAEGVHAFDNFINARLLAESLSASRKYDVAIVKCKIPFGTVYYKGLFRDIAAGKLIVGDMVEIKHHK